MTSIQAKNINHPDHRENLNVEKYNLIREAILASLPAQESGETMSFTELEEAIRIHLDEKQVPTKLFPMPGSVRWYTKAVQLDLEAKEEIERVPNKSPIRLRKRV